MGQVYPKPSMTVAGIRAEVVERLHEVLPNHAVAIRDNDPLSLSLSGASDSTAGLVLNLHALVHDVLRSGSDDLADRLIDAFVTLAGQTLVTPRITLSTVYPLLRHRELLEAVGSGPGTSALVEDGPGDLVTVIAAEVSGGLVLVTEDMAGAAGLAVAEIREAALKNLLSLFSQLCLCEEVDGVLPVMLDGYSWLGSSLILIPGLLRAAMEEEGWSRALVATPVREVVGLVDADRPGAVAALERWMARELDQPRAQSEIVYALSANDAPLRKSHRFDGGRLVALS